MTLKGRRNILVALAFVFAILAVPLPIASAVDQGQSVGQALEIAPPVLNIKANPGDVVKSTISLRDVSTSPLVVRNQINDFVAAGEDGTPKLLLDEEAAEPSPYSLKEWIQPLPQFTLQPREVNQLPVTIRVPANAAPGGYYAVVRFTASPPGIDGSGVSLSASLGTLILLRVNGDAKEDVKIEEFAATKNGSKKSLFESAPITFLTRIKNNGSSHEQPSGQITIKDMFGNATANVNVNLAQNNILPASIRKFEQPLDSTVIGNKILFGRYTADLKMSYGTQGQTITASTSFWVIPYRLVGFALLLILIVIVVIRIALKRYTERVVERSRGRRRRR
ncbi:hypothetical protein H7142_00980 [Candidatus Saccharibacteria bacterium]|nr:hypothetical protein [Candidatus Saccharibacteria bacterium]